MEQQPPESPLAAKTEAPEHQRPLYEAQLKRPRKRRRWIWIVLLCIFALAFYLILRHKPGQGDAARAHQDRDHGPVTLNAAEAHTGEMAVKLLAIGTVTPTYTASITSQVTGKILAVHYRQGQMVTKGAPLIDIDPRPYQAALDTANGTLMRDQGVLAQAKQNLARYQAAWARNAIARQQLDDQAKLVDQDEGVVRSDRGAVEADQVNVDYCHISAPISGRTGLRLVDPGNVVQANSTTPLVVIATLRPITVVFTIPEGNVPDVQKAMRKGRLKVTALDRTSSEVLGKGYLEATDNQIDTTTGTLKLRAVFDNPQLTLFPNQFVNTELLVDLMRNQVLIPNSAIQRNGSQAYVYVLSGGVATITNINVVHGDQVNSAVTGIKTDILVANSSFQRLQDKSKVRIVKQPLAPAEDTESETP